MKSRVEVILVKRINSCSSDNVISLLSLFPIAERLRVSVVLDDGLTLTESSVISMLEAEGAEIHLVDGEAFKPVLYAREGLTLLLSGVGYIYPKAVEMLEDALSSCTIRYAIPVTKATPLRKISRNLSYPYGVCGVACLWHTSYLKSIAPMAYALGGDDFFVEATQICGLADRGGLAVAGALCNGFRTSSMSIKSIIKRGATQKNLMEFSDPSQYGHAVNVLSIVDRLKSGELFSDIAKELHPRYQEEYICPCMGNIMYEMPEEK